MLGQCEELSDMAEARIARTEARMEKTKGRDRLVKGL